MIGIRLAALAVCASTLMFAAAARAEETKASSAPFYLSCDGISSDQRIVRIFKVSSIGISVWSGSQRAWDQLCDMKSGACAMTDKTIAYSVDYSTMVISRGTGQFESHLKNGSTWIGACSKTEEPTPAGGQTPKDLQAPK